MNTEQKRASRSVNKPNISTSEGGDGPPGGKERKEVAERNPDWVGLLAVSALINRKAFSEKSAVKALDIAEAIGVGHYVVVSVFRRFVCSCFAIVEVDDFDAEPTKKFFIEAGRDAMHRHASHVAIMASHDVGRATLLGEAADARVKEVPMWMGDTGHVERLAKRYS